MTEQPDTTELFLRHLGGAEVTERLFPLVYDELKAIARAHLRRGHEADVLQPTALVHEVYLRLIDQTRIDAAGRSHFLALAARTLHRVLVEHVRARRAVKRGGGQRLTLRSGLLARDGPSIDLLALDEALAKLRKANERRAEVVELRFFGGLEIAEVANVLGVSARTVKDDWTYARTFLYRELAGEGPR